MANVCGVVVYNEPGGARIGSCKVEGGLGGITF